MQEKILEKLRELWGLEEESLAVAEYAAERSIALIKAYCNIEEIPQELEGVGVSLAGLLLERGRKVAEGGSIQSIREGDISIHFAENFGAGLTEDEMAAHFRMELERFRRLPG